MNYKNFSAEDFIADEYFITWAQSRHRSDDPFWPTFQQIHPDKKAAIEQAVQFIDQLDFDVDEASPEQVMRMQHQIQSGTRASKSRRTIGNRYKWYAMAAAFLLLFIWKGFIANSTEKTGYGETKTIQLTDGSSILLNANSILRINQAWFRGQQEEAWLNGEAYFTVQPNPLYDRQQFTVHVDDVDIQVLGTQFNVNNRSKEVKVVLDEGKVNLSSKEARLDMQPGEMVAFKMEEDVFQKTQVNTAIYTSWKSNKLTFDNTPISYLLEIIEGNYGYQVKVETASIFEKKLTGTLPSENLDILIKAISTVFGLEVRKAENQILIIK